MKKITIVLIIFTLLNSCLKKDKTITEFYITDTTNIILPLYDTSHNVIYSYQYIETDSGNFLYLYNNNKKITVYNFDKQKLLKEIPLRKTPLSNFYVISKDSILVIYNSAYVSENNDSILFLINSNGKELKNYHLRNKFLYSTNNKIGYDSMYYSLPVFQKFSFNHNKLYIPFTKYLYKYFGDKKSWEEYLNPLSVFDIEKDSLTFLDFKLFYPPTGLFYPKQYNFTFTTLSKDNYPVIAFAFSPTIQEMTATGVIKHRISSALLDTIEPQDSSMCSQFYFYDILGKFSEIYYNPYKKQYYRFVSLPHKLYNSNIIVITDSSFNKLGELIFPYIYSTFLVFSQDYFITFNKGKTYNDLGKLYFTKFKIKKRPTPIDSLKNKLLVEQEIDTAQCNIGTGEKNKRNIKNLLDLYIPEKNYAVLIIPYYYSCPSCKEYAVFSYSLNKHLFAKANVYLFFDIANKAVINDYLSSRNLKVSPKIKLDTSDQYSLYMDGFYNPRVVIVNDNKVTFDKTYYPKELEAMIDTLLIFAENSINK